MPWDAQAAAKKEKGTHLGRGKGRGIPSVMRARQAMAAGNLVLEGAGCVLYAERGNPQFIPP